MVRLLRYRLMMVVMETAAATCPRGWRDDRIHQGLLVKIPLGEKQHGMSDSIRHLIETRIAIVGIGITSQVVAGIIRLPSCAAIGGCLCGCLDALSSGEQTTCRDAVENKRPV